MPSMVGDTREISKNRWSGGPVRSGCRAGFPMGRTANHNNRDHGTACLAGLSGYPCGGVPRLSAAPVPGLHRLIATWSLLVIRIFYFILFFSSCPDDPRDNWTNRWSGGPVRSDGRGDFQGPRVAESRKRW